MERMWILLLSWIGTIVGNPCENRTLQSLPHPGDCQTFIICWLSKPYLRTCPESRYYDVQSNNCQPLSATMCCNISFQFNPPPMLPPLPGTVNLTTQTADPKLTTPRQNLPPLSTTAPVTPQTTNMLPDVTEEFTTRETIATELPISTTIETETYPTDYIVTADTTNELATATTEQDTPEKTTIIELLLPTKRPETEINPATANIFTMDVATSPDVTKLIDITTTPDKAIDWTDWTRESLSPITTELPTEATIWPTELTYSDSTPTPCTETTNEGPLSTKGEATSLEYFSTTDVDDNVATASESITTPYEENIFTHTTELPIDHYTLYTEPVTNTYTPEIIPTDPTIDEITYSSTEHVPTFSETTQFDESLTTELNNLETLPPTTIFPETSERYTEADVTVTFPTKDGLQTLTTSTDDVSSEVSATTPATTFSTVESTESTASITEFYKATTDLMNETSTTTLDMSPITESTSTSTLVVTELPETTIGTNTESNEPVTTKSPSDSTSFFITIEPDTIATTIIPPTTLDYIDLSTVTELFTIPDTTIIDNVDVTTPATFEYTTEPSIFTIKPLPTIPTITMEPKASTYTTPASSESTVQFVTQTLPSDSITISPDLTTETLPTSNVLTTSEELLITDEPILPSTSFTEPFITTSTESTVTEIESGSTIIGSEPTTEILPITSTIEPITLTTSSIEQEESTIHMSTDTTPASSQETTTTQSTLVTNPTEIATLLIDPTISSTLQTLPEITIPETTGTISTDFETSLKPITKTTEASAESNAETTLQFETFTTLSENVSSPTIIPIPSTPSLEPIFTTTQETTEDSSSMETTSEAATYTTIETKHIEDLSTAPSIPPTTSISELSTVPELVPTTQQVTITTEEYPYKVTSTKEPKIMKTLPIVPDEPNNLLPTPTEEPLIPITTPTSIDLEEITITFIPESEVVIILNSTTPQNQLATSTETAQSSIIPSEQTTDQPVATTRESYLTTESRKTTNTLPDLTKWPEYLITESGKTSEIYPTTDKTRRIVTILPHLTTKRTQLDVTSTYRTTIKPTNHVSNTPSEATTKTRKHPLFTLPPLKPDRRHPTTIATRLSLPPIPPTESPCEYYEEKARTTRQPHPLPMCRDGDDFSYPDLGECNFYYRCLKGVMTRKKCDNYFAFSPQTLKCLPSSDANCRKHYSLTEQQVYLDYFVLFNNLVKKYDEDENGN